MYRKFNAVDAFNIVIEVLEDLGYNTEELKVYDSSSRYDILTFLSGAAFIYSTSEGIFSLAQFEYDLEDALTEAGIIRDVEIEEIKAISDFGAQISVVYKN